MGSADEGAQADLGRVRAVRRVERCHCVPVSCGPDRQTLMVVDGTVDPAFWRLGRRDHLVVRSEVAGGAGKSGGAAGIHRGRSKLEP